MPPPEFHGRPKSSDSNSYRFSKRHPPRLPKRKNDIYVNQKSPFIAQFNKSKQLLEAEGVVYIHGLGAAVNSAVNLALQLKSSYLDCVTLEPTTSTVWLVDDYVPKTDSGFAHVDHRKNSAIQIKITHVVDSKDNTQG